MTKIWIVFIAFTIGSGVLGRQTAQAAEPAAATFFKSLHEMKMIISARPAGTYDTYGRLLARHIGHYIPGNPSIVSINMPGASGIKAANYVAQQAPHDGSILTNPRQNFPMYQVLGNLKAVKTDMRDFQWIGSFNATNHVLLTYYTSQVKTLEDAKRKQVLIGASSPKSAGALMSQFYNALLGTKLKVVTGYGGIAEVKLAMNRGEVEGLGSDGWSDLKADFGELLRENKLNILLQLGLQKEPDLPNVPLLLDQAKNPKQVGVMEFITKGDSSLGKPFATSPGVPAKRVAVLRAAFDNTMKDPAFLNDARHLHVEIRPISGQDIQKLVGDVMIAPKTVIQQVRTILKIKEGQAIQ